LPIAASLAGSVDPQGPQDGKDGEYAGERRTVVALVFRRSAVGRGQETLDGADQFTVLERLFEIMLDSPALRRAVRLGGPNDNPRNVLPSIGCRDLFRTVFDMQHNDAWSPFCRESTSGILTRDRAANAIDLETSRFQDRPQHFFRFGKTVDDKHALR
jgi:hypothetical protein